MSAAPAFTPGPWKIDGRSLVVAYCPRTEDFRSVANVRTNPEANARLIAAAPDGFEAGEEAIAALNAMMDAWLDYHDTHGLTQPVTGAAGNAFDRALAAREKLEAFVAKARGETP